MILQILLTLFLVFLNGFFVAAEFAIVKVRISQVELRAQSGSRASKISKHIVNHLDAYLSATQLGITLASLSLGWIGESIVADMVLDLFKVLHWQADPILAHKIALPTAFIIITFLHIVFGELAPKSMAIQYPVRTTFAVAIPLQIFYILLRPFIYVLNKFANFALRMAGISPALGHEAHSSEELQIILEQSKVSGTIETSEHELIKNVFDFRERTVKKVMVPRTKILAINIETPDQEALDIIVREGYSRVPIFKDKIDNIVGVAHAKDILAIVTQQNNFHLKDIIRAPYFVPESKKINDLLAELQQHRIQMAIVLDEFGGTAGIVTLEDIIEELVGEIQDEHDEEKPLVEKISDREFIVNAFAMISDVNEFLPEHIVESDEYDSIGGLMNMIFEKIPEEKETMNFGSYNFIILKKSERNVESVKITYIKHSEGKTSTD